MNSQNLGTSVGDAELDLLAVLHLQNLPVHRHDPHFFLFQGTHPQPATFHEQQVGVVKVQPLLGAHLVPHFDEVVLADAVPDQRHVNVVLSLEGRSRRDQLVLAHVTQHERLDADEARFFQLNPLVAATERQVGQLDVVVAQVHGPPNPVYGVAQAASELAQLLGLDVHVGDYAVHEAQYRKFCFVLGDFIARG